MQHFSYLKICNCFFSSVGFITLYLYYTYILVNWLTYITVHQQYSMYEILLIISIIISKSLLSFCPISWSYIVYFRVQLGIAEVNSHLAWWQQTEMGHENKWEEWGHFFFSALLTDFFRPYKCNWTICTVDESSNVTLKWFSRIAQMVFIYFVHHCL